MGFRFIPDGSCFFTTLENGILSIHVTEDCVVNIDIPKLDFVKFMVDNSYVNNKEIMLYMRDDSTKIVWTFDGTVTVYKFYGQYTKDMTEIWHRERMFNQEIPDLSKQVTVLEKGLMLVGDKGKDRPVFLPTFYICNTTQEIVIGFKYLARRIQIEPKKHPGLVVDILNTAHLEPCLVAYYLGTPPDFADEDALSAIQGIFKYTNDKQEEYYVHTLRYYDNSIIQSFY